MDDLDQTIRNITDHLLAQRVAGGHWEGRLATSALSTATAVAALSLADAAAHEPLIRRGLDWLAANVNADGGWGDTPDSPSNLNTTALCWAAFGRAPADTAGWLAAARRAGAWIETCTGHLEPERIVETILAFYGKDRTFSVPIVTLLALCGRLGPREQAFRKIPVLPFELAAAPPELWRWLQLPVVSYALPALVAIGQARFHHAPPAFAPLRALRRRLCAPTLDVVRRMQAGSGGFLEAVPLTSFVTACLAGIGHERHPIVQDAVRFLGSLVREDGGWPIDTCLSTWVTVLAVHALAADGDAALHLDNAERAKVREWLLGQQVRAVHPFTNVPPGGWAWMDTDGAVPDADDTPGALIALRHLDNGDARVQAAAERGIRWLLGMQNRDGGMPTFCRGWGKLPFDRSAPDITAHSLRAWHAWHDRMDAALVARMDRVRTRALRYLARQQRSDGSWLPLWFGSQDSPGCENPLYGTARVTKALADIGDASAMARRGLDWLLDAQGTDGGWGGTPGGAPSIEETALAVEALAAWQPQQPLSSDMRSAIGRGLAWLLAATGQGTRFPAAPIGLYFAKLWYSEKLYPVVFPLAALLRARQRLAASTANDVEHSASRKLCAPQDHMASSQATTYHRRFTRR
jgi:squalene-hopene/tetraprenyl-beta-curcumene cyclase